MGSGLLKFLGAERILCKDYLVIYWLIFPRGHRPFRLSRGFFSDWMLSGGFLRYWYSPNMVTPDLKAELSDSYCEGLLVINKIASAGKLSFCSSKVLKLSQSLPTLPGFRLGSRVSVGGPATFWKVLPQALNPALTCFGYLFIYLFILRQSCPIA